MSGWMSVCLSPTRGRLGRFPVCVMATKATMVFGCGLGWACFQGRAIAGWHLALGDPPLASRPPLRDTDVASGSQRSSRGGGPQASGSPLFSRVPPGGRGPGCTALSDSERSPSLPAPTPSLSSSEVTQLRAFVEHAPHSIHPATDRRLRPGRQAGVKIGPEAEDQERLCPGHAVEAKGWGLLCSE